MECTSRCRILVRVGPRIFLARFCQWSAAESHKVSLYRPGSRGPGKPMKALEALGFYIAKYAFSLILGTLLSKF